jgi:hypothetical protein
MQHFYYPRTSRGVLISLLDLFNKIQVYTYSKLGDVVSVIDVPLKFGPSEKYHLFNMQMQSGKKYYPKVPSLLSEKTAITIMAVRKTDKVAAINTGFTLRLFIIYLYFTISSIFQNMIK